MGYLDKHWLSDVQQSRIIVLPGDESYIDQIDVRVSTITDKVATGTSDRELQLLHPGLTYDDVRACILFLYLRTVNKL